MTIITGQAEDSFVVVWFRMAVAALGRGIIEVRPLVAPGAARPEVGPYEWKAALLMVEIDQAVFPIVTIQAVIAEILDVTGHKGRVVYGVAIEAGAFFNRVSHILGIMTGTAVHWCRIV